MNNKRIARKLAAQRHQQRQVVGEEVSWDEIESGAKCFGNCPMIQSTRLTSFFYTNVNQLNAKDYNGKEVTIRARIHTLRARGKICFLLLRQEIDFVPAVVVQTPETPDGLVKYVSKLSKETIVDIVARVTKPEHEIKCNLQYHIPKDIELHIVKCFAVSQVATLMPLLVEDAMRSTTEDGETQITWAVSQDNRLNNRVIDMRAPGQLAIFKIQSAIGRFFREYLYSQDFIEIHTPKLVGTALRGTDLFEVNYFGNKAYLADSPQWYKQMAVNGGLLRVFEIGPAYYSMPAHSHRHLTEFVRLDLEMTITSHYSEALDLIDQMFIYIFNNIESKLVKELDTIHSQYPFERLVYNKEKNLRLTYREAIQLLRGDGMEIEDLGDIDTPTMKRLSRLVKAKYNTDFYFLEKYPMAFRPFYTMPCPYDPRYSNSYDIFLRGDEISSGAQRIHDSELLVEKAKEKGVDMAPLQAYVDAFRYGAFPHAGCGIGLERIVMSYLGIGNVRKTSMFPRDSRRLIP